MKEKLYLNGEVAIVNFDTAYPNNQNELVASNTLGIIVNAYLKNLEKYDKDFYVWITNGKTREETCKDLSILFRKMMVFSIDELEENYYLKDKEKLLVFVDDVYDFWKSHQRFSVMRQRYSGTSGMSLVKKDSKFNSVVRNSYRTLVQALSGRKNGIYRQVQAGSNAGISVYKKREFYLSDTYEMLQPIYMIESVMLRTPMIMSTKSNKREGMFSESDINPISYFTGDRDSWFCYPAKVGKLLINVYFHRDFLVSGVALANLFELASAGEVDRKPDAIVLFANEDGKDETVFHYDEKEDLWVGGISYNEKVQYFGYMKKMMLTLHNLAMMKKGWLPIHGAFINVTLFSGERKGIMLMGDSGAGKSESIEALRNVAGNEIKDIEVVFDDMGTIHIEDGVPYGQGSEIGAFIRLDDLEPGTPYRDMDRSIFFNPDILNARVITPAAPYRVIARNHKIDLFAYANNYDKNLGMRKIEDMEEAKKIFVEGKRMAKGTTQEVGISRTYFANPFGPMQAQAACNPIIDKVFACLKKNDIYVGEVFTHLGLDKSNRKGINIAAKELLKFIKE
ncbi:MAG: hypothetical protein ACK5KR_07745 [Breznakia sp.]